MYNASKRMPEAFITVNKNRQKIYNANDVYLNDNTEFEIEIFNPTQFTVGALFEINGTLISHNYLVLKPGQRIYLNRYIDDNNKFLYSTYTIDNIKSVKEVEEAIAKNGNIRIKFFKQAFSSPVRSKSISKPKSNFKSFNREVYGSAGLNDGTGKLDDNGFTWQNDPGTFTDHSLTTMSFIDMDQYNQQMKSFPLDNMDQKIGQNSNINDYITTNFLQVDFEPLDLSKHLDIKPEEKKIETGTIESGARSDQEFETVKMQFEFFAIHTLEYNILPMVNKPIEAKDLIRYCTNCGEKSKKEHNFCAKCGTKL